MRTARRAAIQLLLGALFAGVLLAVGPGAPEVRLGAAINYSYRLLLPGIAGDGTD